MNNSQQKGKIFTGVVSTNYPKDGKNVQQATEHTLNKALFIILPNSTCSLEKNSHFILVHLVATRRYSPAILTSRHLTQRAVARGHPVQPGHGGRDVLRSPKQQRGIGPQVFGDVVVVLQRPGLVKQLLGQLHVGFRRNENVVGARCRRVVVDVAVEEGGKRFGLGSRVRRENRGDGGRYGGRGGRARLLVVHSRRWLVTHDGKELLDISLRCFWKLEMIYD